MTICLLFSILESFQWSYSNTPNSFYSLFQRRHVNKSIIITNYHLYNWQGGRDMDAWFHFLFSCHRYIAKWYRCKFFFNFFPPYIWGWVLSYLTLPNVLWVNLPFIQFYGWSHKVFNFHVYLSLPITRKASLVRLRFCNEINALSLDQSREFKIIYINYLGTC